MPNITIKRIDHVAITAGDADAVAKFYISAFGAREAYRLGPLSSSEMPRHAERDWTEAHLGVADATLKIIMLKVGSDDFGIEIFQYDAPRHASAQPLPSNAIGASHIGFVVDDVDESAVTLAALGCDVVSATIAIPEGPTAHQRFRYFRDPFGHILELVDNKGSSQHA